MFRRRTRRPDEKLAAEIEAWAEKKAEHMWRDDPSPKQVRLAGEVADRLNATLEGDLAAQDILDLFRVGGSVEPFPDYYTIDVGPDPDEHGERSVAYGAEVFDHLRDKDDPAFQTLLEAAREDNRRKEQELDDAAGELLAFCRSKRANVETVQLASGSKYPGDLRSFIVLRALKRWQTG